MIALICRCVTTKGSILNSSVFTLEESENQISNDDKILQTALNLCKNNVDRYEGEFNGATNLNHLKC